MFDADVTGFQPNSGFGQVSSPPPVPPMPPLPQNNQNNSTAPANVFASMKSGTFGNDSAPQASGTCLPFICLLILFKGALQSNTTLYVHNLLDGDSKRAIRTDSLAHSTDVITLLPHTNFFLCVLYVSGLAH